MTQSLPDQEQVREFVRDRYGKVAQATSRDTPLSLLNNTGSTVTGCCTPGPDTHFDPDKFIEQVGYSAKELSELPEGANMGLSCGNPTAIAQLKPGEVVLDLGSGGGFDAFLAGPKVGATGRVIGVDMTPEMIGKARRNLAAYRKAASLDNVEFRLGEIEHLPVADASVDVVISNCVINLSTDKPQVWREIARVLKPGGRVAVSDLSLFKPLPAEVAAMIEAWAGCIAGASLVEDIRHMAHDAGLTQINLAPKPEYVQAMLKTNDQLIQQIIAKLPDGAGPADYLTSLNIEARKPQ